MTARPFVILYVEDNEYIRESFVELLATDERPFVSVADGASARQALREQHVDLLLTDWVMPDMDGAALVEKIKTLSPHTPAILLSGKVKVYPKETSADLFLPKGAHEPMELLERVRQLLVRKRGPKRTAPLPATSASPRPAARPMVGAA